MVIEFKGGIHLLNALRLQLTRLSGVECLWGPPCINSELGFQESSIISRWATRFGSQMKTAEENIGYLILHERSLKWRETSYKRSKASNFEFSIRFRLGLILFKKKDLRYDYESGLRETCFWFVSVSSHTCACVFFFFWREMFMGNIFPSCLIST